MKNYSEIFIFLNVHLLATVIVTLHFNMPIEEALIIMVVLSNLYLLASYKLNKKSNK